MSCDDSVMPITVFWDALARILLLNILRQYGTPWSMRIVVSCRRWPRIGAWKISITRSWSFSSNHLPAGLVVELAGGRPQTVAMMRTVKTVAILQPIAEVDTASVTPCMSVSSDNLYFRSIEIQVSHRYSRYYLYCKLSRSSVRLLIRDLLTSINICWKTMKSSIVLERYSSTWSSRHTLLQEHSSSVPYMRHHSIHIPSSRFIAASKPRTQQSAWLPTTTTVAES